MFGVASHGVIAVPFRLELLQMGESQVAIVQCGAGLIRMDTYSFSIQAYGLSKLLFGSSM